MAELVGVQTADAVQGLLGTVVKIIQLIYQARCVVRDLPKDIEDLLEEVRVLQDFLLPIKAGSSDRNDCLEQPRAKLQQTLDRALAQLNDLKGKQEQDKSHEVWKVLKATVKRGDGKRQKEVNSTREAIKRGREELDKALTASTHLTGESTHEIVTETQKKMDVLLLKAEATEVPSVLRPGDPPIIFKLDGMARDGNEDESHNICCLIWDSETEEYRVLEQSPGKDVEDAEGEIKRGVREGGWEVKNSTKVQFRMKVPEDRHFYLLSYEKPLTIATTPELVFPKYLSDRNKILSSGERKFPDRNKYRNDPMSCKVDQSPESLKAGEEGQVLLYLVFSEEPLHVQGMS